MRKILYMATVTAICHNPVICATTNRLEGWSDALRVRLKPSAHLTQRLKTEAGLSTLGT